MFNGLQLEGSFIAVKKARFQKPPSVSKMPSMGRYQYEIQGKVWQPKVQPLVREEGLGVQHKKQQDQQEERLQQQEARLSFNLTGLDEA